MIQYQCYRGTVSVAHDSEVSGNNSKFECEDRSVAKTYRTIWILDDGVATAIKDATRHGSVLGVSIMIPQVSNRFEILLLKMFVIRTVFDFHIIYVLYGFHTVGFLNSGNIRKNQINCSWHFFLTI